MKRAAPVPADASSVIATNAEETTTKKARVDPPRLGLHLFVCYPPGQADEGVHIIAWDSSTNPAAAPRVMAAIRAAAARDEATELVFHFFEPPADPEEERRHFGLEDVPVADYGRWRRVTAGYTQGGLVALWQFTRHRT